MEILYIPTNPVQCGIFCIKKEVFSTSSFKWWALRGSNSRHLPCKGQIFMTLYVTKVSLNSFKQSLLNFFCRLYAIVFFYVFYSKLHQNYTKNFETKFRIKMLPKNIYYRIVYIMKQSHRNITI